MPDQYRVLVTGSRTWPEPAVIIADLEAVHLLHGRYTLVHGHCPKGADRVAHDWAKKVGPDVVEEERHPADWNRWGKQAGFIRNAEMVQLGADLVLAYIHAGSAGATDTATQAEKAWLRVSYRRRP